MILIVGLGNPGEKYEKTRHNIGFVALDTLLKKFESLEKTFWNDEKKLKALTKKINFGHDSILLVKPTTFMNDSGISAMAVSSYYKIKPDEIIVIQDDLDLPLGKIRVRFGGGHGGHKGIESIINNLNTDKFLRVRLGIGHPHRHEGKLKEGKSHLAVEDYVLSNFASPDRGKVKSMINQTIRIVEKIIEHGIEVYLGKYNHAKTPKKQIVAE